MLSATRRQRRRVDENTAFVYGPCIMPSITITLNTEAHARLKERKEPGESYSDVVLRELPPLAQTCGELLDSLKTHPPPKVNPKLIEAVIAGRGHRSKRHP